MHQIGLLNKFKSQLICFVRNFTKNYEQGQSFTNVNGKTVREYFYNIDHQGQVNKKSVFLEKSSLVFKKF